jgi:hypothetical protein
VVLLLSPVPRLIALTCTLLTVYFGTPSLFITLVWI